MKTSRSPLNIFGQFRTKIFGIIMIVFDKSNSRFKSYGDQLWNIRGPNRLQKNGVYDKFLVDVKNIEERFFRAYIVDVTDAGVFMNWDCTDNGQLVFAPFEDVREVSSDSPLLTDIKGSIEVLVPVNDDGLEFWFPGRILEMVHFKKSLVQPEWSLAKVEITLDGGATIQLVINDGPHQACRRIREVKESATVTPRIYRKFGYDWPEGTIRCPDPKREFPEAQSCRSFAYWWLKRTKTMFMSATYDYVAILHKGKPADSVGWHIHNTIILQEVHPYEKSWCGYLEWFREVLLNGSNGIMCDMMQSMVECVIFTEENGQENSITLEDIHHDLRLLTLSYLNVYDRVALQGVSMFWKQLLSSHFVQRDLIITCLPSEWTLTRDSVHFLPIRNSVPDIISILCHSIVKETRTLYLVGTWFLKIQPSLHSLIACLKFLSVKLDWIVLADNCYFTPQAFIQFQTMGKYLNQIPQQIPDFAAVCTHLAIKNSGFGIESWDFVPFNFSPANLNTPKRFQILIARWSFCFKNKERDGLALSLIDMLERCCPDLDPSIAERIHGRVDRFPKNIHTSFREDSFDAALWFLLVFAMERWRVNIPRNVNEVQRFLKGESNGSGKKLLLQTLAYWSLLETYQALPYIRPLEH